MNYKTLISSQNKMQHIRQMVPKKYNRFVDPAIGDGSTFLNIKPSKWLINDEHCATHNMWKMLKTNPKDVIRCLRSDYFDEISQPAHAALFMYIHDNKYIKTQEGFYNNDYFKNLDTISTFLNDTSGDIINIPLQNFVDFCKPDDFLFLDFANLKNNAARSSVTRSLNILDAQNVKWMLIHDNNAYTQITFQAYNKTALIFNEDQLLIRNY
jgi:site-specific DNA-adenine methylase